MKRFPAIWASLVAGLLLVAPACTAPGTGTRTNDIRGGVPGAVSSPQPNSSGLGRAGGGAPAAAGSWPMQQHAVEQPPMQQHEAAHSSVALAGYRAPVSGSSGGSACACGGGACGATEPAAATHRRGDRAFAGHHWGAAAQRQPHGYAPVPPVPNVYGIDRQEFLCDGGDHPPEASLRRDDSIAGLQPEDTVVHYTTESGDIEFDASNPVCVYSPRFASVRKITGALAGGRAIGAAGLDKPVGPNRLNYDLPGLVVAEATELGRTERTRRPDAMRDRNRGVPIEGVLQPEQAEEILTVVAGLSVQEINRMRDAQLALLEKAAQAAVTWAVDESVEVAIEDLKAPTLVRDQQVEAFTVYEFPEAGRLRICKLADRGHAPPGEQVRFTLRIDNVGDSAVNRVTIADNLTTRLEYVDGSQTSSIAADFETSPNDAQSLRLQWTLQEELKVGESAVIEFTTRVR